MVPNFGEGGGVGEVFIGGRLSALARFFCIQAMSYRFEYSTNLATGPPNIEDLLLLPQQKIQPLVLLIIWEDMCR